ncbi:MAG: hypothetical protein N2999_04735 [Proteobacteria bacterium]|nr:hypothetical protein [Pseudomonadota bacterium]
MAQIQNPEQAYRLAKAILSDILLYNQEKVKKGIEDDNLFEVLSAEIEEGRKLFESRVPANIPKEVYDKALVDVIFKSAGRYSSKIW